MAPFTTEFNPRLAKRPLKTNGRLANRGLTSLVKEATGVLFIFYLHSGISYTSKTSWYWFGVLGPLSISDKILWSLKAEGLVFRIVWSLQFDRHLVGIANMPVKFQSNAIIKTTNLAALRLCEILRLRRLTRYWIKPWSAIAVFLYCYFCIAISIYIQHIFVIWISYACVKDFKEIYNGSLFVGMNFSLSWNKFVFI